MPKQLLNKNHVVVHTATIDVKVLRIEKKQVTMSVFRQLPEGDIFYYESHPKKRWQLLLNGDPWGIVRYTWKGCETWVEMHLVFERDGQLFRMPIPKSDYDDGLLVYLYNCRIPSPAKDEREFLLDDLVMQLDYFRGLDQLFIAV